MEFLLNIEIHFTPDINATRRKDLVAQEHDVAEGLKTRGHLVRIWRTPCRFGNWSLGRAADATELHEVVSSPPLHPWMQVNVHPLGKHPLDPPGADGGVE